MDDLVKHLMRIGNLPYLFIGSGFSRRHINMENWQDLLENICKKINLPYPFPYYLTESNRDFPLLGQLISDAFYELFYSANLQSTLPYITDEVLKSGNKETPLKYFISNYINSKSTTTPNLEEEIELLKEAKIAGIITTNWDCLLEQIFPDFKCYVGQEMIFAETLNYGEILKIHGSVAQPDTLILTKRDYEDYDIRNAYLTAKILTIFVEHPILFIGYSLSDPNILSMITSVFQCISKRDQDKFKDRLIFVEFDHNATTPTFMDSTLPIGGGSFLPIKHIKANEFKDVYTALQKLEQTIPTKLLVRLKNILYEFVVNNKANDKVYVGNIEDIDDDKLDKIQAVFGIGVTKMFEYGYRSISAKDIFIDMLSEDTNFDVDNLFKLTYPSIFKSGYYFPIYKYLKIKNINSLDEITQYYPDFNSSILNKLKRINFNKLKPSQSYIDHHQVEVNQCDTFAEFLAKYDKRHVILYVHLLNYNKIDLDQFREFLLDNFDAHHAETDFKKAMCLYDILKYGQ